MRAEFVLSIRRTLLELFLCHPERSEGSRACQRVSGRRRTPECPSRFFAKAAFAQNDTRGRSPSYLCHPERSRRGPRIFFFAACPWHRPDRARPARVVERRVRVRIPNSSPISLLRHPEPFDFAQGRLCRGTPDLFLLNCLSLYLHRGAGHLVLPYPF